MATLELYVDNEDSTGAWGTTGTTPYIDAQDEPTNLISSTSRNANSGVYSFQTTAQTGTINSVKLYIYAYGVATNDFQAILSGSGTGLGPPAGSWQWVNVDVSAILTSWALINAATVYFDRPNTTNDAGVDACYLLVNYTASATVTISTAAVSASGVANFLDAPITRVMDTAVITNAGPQLSVSAPPAGATVILGTASTAISGVSLRVGQTVKINSSALAASGIGLSVNVPVTIGLSTGAIAAGGIGFAVGTVTTISLDTAPVTPAGVDLTVDAPPPSLSVTLGTASIVPGGVALSIDAPIAIGLSTGILTANGVNASLQIVSGQIVALDTASVFTVSPELLLIMVAVVEIWTIRARSFGWTLRERDN